MVNDRIPFDACPLCNQLAALDLATADCSKHPLYDKSLAPVMHWKQCPECAHVFTSGYFTEEACKLIYSRTNEHQQLAFDIERQRHISSRMVDKILPYTTTGAWLDVGFGNGSLLFTAQEYGFEPIGLDLRLDNAQKMATLGIQTYCEDLTRLRLNFNCAVISMADVLEHMPFPKGGLKAAYELLTEDGVLFLSMPNMESVVWKILDQQKANPYWGEIEHYHNFTRTRLFALLRETGFEPVRYAVSERYRVCMEVIALKAGKNNIAPIGTS